MVGVDDFSDVAGGLAVVIEQLVDDDDVEDHAEQVALAVGHARAGGVRPGHDVTTLRTLAVGRHVDLVGAFVTLVVGHVCEHANHVR